jgi:hypothetical protein
MNDQQQPAKFDDKFLSSIHFINEVKVYNEVQNEKKVLIFDLRKKTDYEKCHLDFSINIPYNEYDEDFMKIFNLKKIKIIQDTICTSEELKEMISRYKRYFIVIIMSHEKINKTNINSVLNGNQENKEIITKSLLFYKALISNRVRELGLYNKGFVKFYNNYFFLTVGINNNPNLKYMLLYYKNLVKSAAYLVKYLITLFMLVIKIMQEIMNYYHI